MSEKAVRSGKVSAAEVAQNVLVVGGPGDRLQREKAFVLLHRVRNC